MPVFHTKTIESILEPVAQQVIQVSKDSFLVIIIIEIIAELFHQEIRNLLWNFGECYTLI